MELNTICNEDCRETMRNMPDNYVNLVLTSPPYNMNLRIMNGKYCSRQVIKEEFSTKYDNFPDNLPIEEYYALHKEILTELLRVSNIIFYNIQIVTGSKRAFFKLIGDFSDQLKDIIVWDKMVAQPAMKDKVLNRQSELILVFEKEGAISRRFDICNFERGSMSDVWQIKRGKKIDKTHGAVFPEELADKIITNFSNVGDIIYDPFMGSGTTAVSALKNNRLYIGSELSSKYCSIANERIKSMVVEYTEDL